MTRIIRSLLISFLIVIGLSADTDDAFKRVEIYHTDLHITIAADTASLYGEVHYTAVAQEDLSDETPLRMHYYWLQIDSVAVNGDKVQHAFILYPEVEYFEILIPESMTILSGDTLTISIWYTRFADSYATDRDSLREGYYFFKQGASRWGQTAPQTIGYTMSQPRDARAWFPAVDKPWNKSTLTMRITVDHPVAVIATGELIQILKNPNGDVTYVYDHPYPIAPYLFAFNAGPFNEYKTTYTLNDGVTIPVASYLFEADAAWADSANSMMKNMLDVFEELFGPYPFDRYGMIAIQPFRFGGMEHQTLSTMLRTLFLSERVTAHELAHQWWGNLVTCESWENIWLNEGFATYSEALYTEAKNGPEARDAVLEWFANGYFSEDETKRYPLYNPPEGYMFGRAIYRKGAWVLHMLRNLVGGETFFTALRQYASNHAYSTAGTADFRNVFENIADRNLNWFFNQWIYQAGYPVYHVISNIQEKGSESTHNITIQLNQKQENAPDIFEGPVEFLVRSEIGDTVLTFWNDKREQEFLFSYESKPDTIIFDPDRKILKKIGVVSLIEERDELPGRITLAQNYPNPFNTATVIEYTIPEEMHVRIRVIDTLGREIKVLIDEYVTAGRYSTRFDASGFASGVYFAVLEGNGSSKVRKMTYIR